MSGKLSTNNSRWFVGDKEAAPVVTKVPAAHHAAMEQQDAFDELDFTCDALIAPQEGEHRGMASGGPVSFDPSEDDGQDTEEFSPELLRDLGVTGQDMLPVPFGKAVANHRHGKAQEDRHFAREFPALSEEEARSFLIDSIARIDRETTYYEAGSTLTSVIVTKTGELVVAHLGDSPVSAVIIGEDGELKRVLQLTEDHKPSVELQSGVAGGIAYEDFMGRRSVLGAGSINMTRALGDRRFGDALSHEPEVNTHHIQDQLRPGDRLFLLVTSDGAHNERIGVTHGQHADSIQRGLAANLSLNRIAQQISDSSAPIQDNVTVLLLEVQVGKGVIVGVLDGHSGCETSQKACSLFERYVAELPLGK